MKKSFSLSASYAAIWFSFLIAFSLTAFGEVSLPAAVTSFSQAYSGTDGYWGECDMGTYGCRDSLSISGCLITSFAMVLDYYGIDLSISREYACDNRDHTGMDPGILNDWLKLRGGYGKCGDEPGNCCLRWDHLPSQISTTTYENRSEDGLDSKAELIIERALLDGYPVVCGVHWGEHCNWSLTENEDCHWVVITGKRGSTYEIIDPYNENTADRHGLRTTLDQGALGSYTIDRYVVIRGETLNVGLHDLRLSLQFNPEGTGTFQDLSLIHI